LRVLISTVQGGSRNEIEKIVNSDYDLKICADLANKLKHGKLKQSRSGLFPSFGELEFSFDHKAISSLTFTDKDVIFDIGLPNDLNISVPVKDDSETNIKDGLTILIHGIHVFENYFNKLCLSINHSATSAKV
jgi:hypothetical protein